MPTVIQQGPYRFFFYASDRDEPRHIHVDRDAKAAKYWLDPIRLQSSGGFKREELKRIRDIIEQNHRKMMEAWDDYFGT